MIISSSVIGLIVLPGILYFGPDTRMNYPLLLWSDSLIRDIWRGLGIIYLPFTSTAPSFGVWESIFTVSAIIGVIFLFRKPKHPYFSSLLIGAAVQVALIIIADYLLGYWFSPRQLIHLIPTVISLAAFGLVHIAHSISGRVEQTFYAVHVAGFRISSIVYGMLLIIIVASSAPRIAEYY